MNKPLTQAGADTLNQDTMEAIITGDTTKLRADEKALGQDDDGGLADSLDGTDDSDDMGL